MRVCLVWVTEFQSQSQDSWGYWIAANQPHRGQLSPPPRFLLLLPLPRVTHLCSLFHPFNLRPPRLLDYARVSLPTLNNLTTIARAGAMTSSTVIVLLPLLSIPQPAPVRLLAQGLNADLFLLLATLNRIYSSTPTLLYLIAPFARPAPSHARYSPRLVHHATAHRQRHFKLTAPDHPKTHHEHQRPHLPARLALEPHHPVRGVHPGAKIPAKGVYRTCFPEAISLTRRPRSSAQSVPRPTMSRPSRSSWRLVSTSVRLQEGSGRDTSLTDSANELLARFLRVPPVGH